MTHRADLHTRLAYAAAWVRGQTDLVPAAGVILGSGLSALADRLEEPAVIPYQDIPHFPVSRVEGHAGRLVVGRLPAAGGAVPVAVLAGRVHAYEGWPAEEVAFGARLLCALGARVLCLTNAAGGVDPSFAPGDLVRITDHLNLSGVNPLVGPNDDRLGPRFPDLSEAWDGRLGALLEEAGREAGVPLRRGVYACVLGPSYETPAEIRMLAALGAQLVGMSTVPEAIAARHMGVPVVGISLVTNPAAGLSGARLDHADVQRVAGEAAGRLEALLRAFLPRAAH